MSRFAVRPAAGEVPDFYAAYVRLVPDGPIDDTLENQLDGTLLPLEGMSDQDALRRYAPDKWSIKEVIGHLTDNERIMGYRALRMARGDAMPLSGYEQDDYVAAAGFDRRPLPDLVAELRTARADVVALFRGLDEEALGRRGTASGVSFTARAFAWIIAGHELHHRRVLQDRYLNGG